MIQAVPMRERMLKIRLSEEEAAVLNALATHYGLNVSDVVRLLARERARELGLLIEKPKSRKRA